MLGPIRESPSESENQERALVVEADDILGVSRHFGDDKADARIEFARMPLNFGDDPARVSTSFLPDR